MILKSRILKDQINYSDLCSFLKLNELGIYEMRIMSCCLRNGKSLELFSLYFKRTSCIIVFESDHLYVRK